MPTISLDFETFYAEGFSIQTHGLHGYTHDERFDPYMVSVCDGSRSWAGAPRNFNWDCLEGATIVSHNAAFDRTVYEAMVEQGLAPRVRYADWVCSANMSAYLCNRRSLAEAAEYLLGVHVDKGMRNYMKGRHWSDVRRDEPTGLKLLEYAGLDAVHCHALWDRFSDRWPAHERELSRLTIDQGTRGIQLNQDLLCQYIGLAQDSVKAIEATLPWLETGGKATSPKMIAEQCRKNGIPSPPIKSHEDGEEKFAWWEAEFGPRFPWIRAVGNWRVMNKFLGSVERMKHWSRPDGTMPFSLKYWGAHTGRWSGDSGLNMQNLRKEPIQLDADTRLPAGPETPPEKRIDLDIRRLFLARPGKRMIISDLSQIEPRVLAWVCGNHDLLREIAGGMSIYEVHARQSLGWTGGPLKEQDKKLYARAKAEVLALGYGCGAEKYVDAAMKMANHKVDPDQAVKEVQEFRDRNPKIVKLWRALDDAFKRSVGGAFEMTLPSGRVMRYPGVKTESRRFRDKEGKVRMKAVYTADIGGIRRGLYGGLLTENLVQATSRDLFAEHVLDLSRTSGINVPFTVHDEAVLEVDSGVELADVERIMSRTPDWLAGCPITCEAKQVPHYQK